MFLLNRFQHKRVCIAEFECHQPSLSGDLFCIIGCHGNQLRQEIRIIEMGVESLIVQQIKVNVYRATRAQGLLDLGKWDRKGNVNESEIRMNKILQAQFYEF